MSALSADDVWAVGVYVTSDGKYHSLAVHWNGIVWTYVPSLDVGSTNTVFNSAVAIAPGDVWAVGYSQDGNAPIRTLVEHWNGSSWRIVPSPSPGTGNSQLFRIAAVRPPGFRTLMASGAYTDANGRVQPLVERWTGSSWVVQPVPDPGTAAELSGIELLASGEAWAVGAYLDASSNARPLAEHWNGRSWAVVPAPDPGSGYLRAVAARSIADVWAVGYSVTAGVMRTLAEHWNGASWSIIPTPNATPNNNVLYGVTVSSTRIPYALSGRVLAVGFANHIGPPGAPTQQLLECYF